jgi:hypothetical protein
MDMPQAASSRMMPNSRAVLARWDSPGGGKRIAARLSVQIPGRWSSRMPGRCGAAGLAGSSFVRGFATCRQRRGAH